MHQINLKYQIVAYGNYNEVSPNAEIMKFFITEFSDKNLIPNTFQELNVNTSINGFRNETVNRLALSSQNKDWGIRFNKDKIDITLTNGSLSDEFMTVHQFVTEAIDILNRIAKQFPKKHNRIGFTTQILTKGVDSKSMYDLFNNPIDYFNQEKPLQWNNKFASRKLIEIDKDKNEIVNINTDIGWVKGRIGLNIKFTEFEGFLMGLDINTQFEERSFRYDTSHIESFVKNVVGVEKDIRDELNKRINIF